MRSAKAGGWGLGLWPFGVLIPHMKVLSGPSNLANGKIGRRRNRPQKKIGEKLLPRSHIAPLVVLALRWC